MNDDVITAKEVCVKQSGEKIIYTMDFSARIGSGVTISSIDSVSAFLLNDEETDDLTIEEEQISGKKVLFFISGGEHAKRYRVEVKINLSNEEILIGGGMLRVLDY